jgi:hypothetical protein
MAKFKVEVGGFVTVFRHRELTIYADNEAEAKEKARNKFFDLQNANPTAMISECTIDSVEPID